jgi:hypothetical protein
MLVVGVLIIVAGGLVSLAAAPQSARIPFAALSVFVGLLFMAVGIGRLRSRLEIYPDMLVDYWLFTKRETPIAHIDGATLAERDTLVDRSTTPGRIGYWRPSAAAVWTDIFLVGMVYALLGWLFFPTQGRAHVLYLLPHHGRPIMVPAVTTRRSNKDYSDAAAAHGAVVHAIADYGRRHPGMRPPTQMTSDGLPAGPPAFQQIATHDSIPPPPAQAPQPPGPWEPLKPWGSD